MKTSTSFRRGVVKLISYIETMKNLGYTSLDMYDFNVMLNNLDALLKNSSNINHECMSCE